MAVKVGIDTCIGRDACTGACPAGALSISDDGKSVCNEGICIDCGSYVSACPVSAISQ